jgi:hypothetical protein
MRGAAEVACAMLFVILTLSLMMDMAGKKRGKCKIVKWGSD